MSLLRKIRASLSLVYKEIQKLNSTNTDVIYWQKQKLKELETLLLVCSGFWGEAYAADYIGIPGKESMITIQVVSKNNCSIKLNSVSFCKMILPLHYH